VKQVLLLLTKLNQLNIPRAAVSVCSALNVDVQLSSTWFKKIIFYFVLIAASSVNVEPSATWSKSKVLASAQSNKTKEKNQRAGMSSV